jgi:Domain of unknown function (DUF4864)
MFYVRRLHVLLPVLLLALPLYAQQRDLIDTDRAAIRTVIERQLDALRQDDAASAFALASPEIQAKFETPGTFSDNGPDLVPACLPSASGRVS